MATNHLVFPAASGLIGDVHDSQRNPIGLKVFDDNGGVYVYMQGVANNSIVGTWVTFDHAFVPSLITANAVGLVAISMAVNTLTTSFNWYCVVSPNGGVTGRCDTIAAGAAVYIDGTDGRVDDAVVSGDLVLNAFSRSSDASNLATFEIAYPSVNNILG